MQEQVQKRCGIVNNKIKKNNNNNIKEKVLKTSYCV